MNRRRRDANPPDRRHAGGEEFVDVRSYLRERQPAQARRKSARQVRCGRRQAHYLLYSGFVSTRDRDHGAREDSRRSFCFQQLFTKVPSEVLGQTESIKIGIQAIVQLHQIAQRIMRGANGLLPENGQKDGFLGMLFNDGWNGGQKDSFPERRLFTGAARPGAGT